jgi:thiol-disulfide isomerase/thioredoxin
MKAILRSFVLVLSIVVAAIVICPGQDAQSGDPQAGNATQKKPRRVWTEDDLQQLSGGVSVVGQESKPRSNAQQAQPTHAAPLARYKLEFNARTIDGAQITEDDVKGKVLLVQFWTTWCPHCRNDQPAVDRVYSDLAGKGLVVLAVDVDEPENDLRRYLSLRPRGCPVITDKNTNLVALRPPKSGFPTYVVVDRNGNVAGSRSGELGDAGIRRLLQKAGL